MAKTQIKRVGFGQVELNQVTGIVDASLYAQLPSAVAMGTILEQGRFAHYDMADGVVDIDKAASASTVNTKVVDLPWFMIYNEEQHFDEREPYHKDYAMKAADFIEGVMVPRLMEINVGDFYTTNTFGANTDRKAEVAGASVEVGDKIYVGEDGYLTIETATRPETGAVAGKVYKAKNSPEFQVVKVYTMPDAQAGVKIVRIK